LNVSFKIARCAVRYDFEGVEERHGNYTILFLSGFQIPCHQARKIRECLVICVRLNQRLKERTSANKLALPGAVQDLIVDRPSNSTRCAQRCRRDFDCLGDIVESIFNLL